MTQQLPLEFTVLGAPKGKSVGARNAGSHAMMYIKKVSREYMNTIIESAKERLNQGVWRPLPEGAPCKVEIYAYFSVPTSLSRARKKAQSGTYVMKKPDPDNIEKCVYDALVQAGVLYDDNQIAIAGETIKLWCEVGEERTTIRVTELPLRPEDDPWQ